MKSCNFSVIEVKEFKKNGIGWVIVHIETNGEGDYQANVYLNDSERPWMEILTNSFDGLELYRSGEFLDYIEVVPV